MFDSLKKKFNNTIGTLTDKVSEEAKKEAEESGEELVEVKSEPTDSKIEKLEEDNSSENSDTKSSDEEEKNDSEDKTSFFSIFKRKSSDDSKSSEDSKEKDDDEDTKSIDDAENTKDKSNNEPIADTKDSEDDSESEKKSKLSIFKRKSDDEKSEEEPSKKESKGIFAFIREKTLSENDLEDILWDLEMSLLESDVALEVTEKIINSVKEDLVGKKIRRSNDVSKYTTDALKKAITEILDIDSKNMEELIKEKQKDNEPLIVMFVGINGTGKTTTIAKLSTHFINKGYTPVIAASDTFRAGAIEQITHHAENIGVKIIKHKKGADPAAVAYDAVAHAKAKGRELVFVDTAGRMQTNKNLMDEMAKIKRVVSPDLIIFVGDSLTGNDVVEQASKFNDAVGLDGIILTKADADSKGGAALSIGYVINTPILYLGVGQGYDDIMEFKPEWMVEQLF